MSKSWPTVTLGEIFNIVRGGSPRPIDKFITDDPHGINWILIGDATEGSKYIASTRKKIKVEGAQRSRRVKPGDFLLTNSMSFGRPYIVATDGCIHDGWLALSPRREVDADYFYHLLGSSRVYAEFERLAAGATVKNLNIDLVRGVRVALPPLSEQRRIANVLDKADALRIKRRAAIAQLDTLAQSIFLDMFGDAAGHSERFQARALSEFCTFLSGYAWKANRFSKEPVGLPIIRIQNVDTEANSEFVYWPDAYQERFVVQKGDLLLTLSGSFRIAQWMGPDALLNQRIVKIVPKPAVELRWLLHALRQLVARIGALGRHALVNNVALADLKDVPLIHPPQPLQKKFEDCICDVDRLKSSLRNSEQATERLCSSIQRSLFDLQA